MQNAEKISITVTSEMLQVIRASVASGEYASTSEVLRDAMRVWQREREERQQRLEAIRERVTHSLADPRPAIDANELRARLAAHHARAVKGQGDEEP